MPSAGMTWTVLRLEVLSVRRAGWARLRTRPSVALGATLGLVAALAWNLEVNQFSAAAFGMLEPAGALVLARSLVVGAAALWLIGAVLASALIDGRHGPLAWSAGVLPPEANLRRGLALLAGPVGAACLLGGGWTGLVIIRSVPPIPGSTWTAALVVGIGCLRLTIVTAACAHLARTGAARRYGTASGPVAALVAGACALLAAMVPAVIWRGERSALMMVAPTTLGRIHGGAGLTIEIAGLALVGAVAGIGCGRSVRSADVHRRAAGELRPRWLWACSPRGAALCAVAVRQPVAILSLALSGFLVVVADLARLMGWWSEGGRWTLALVAVATAASVVEPARQEHGAVMSRWPPGPGVRPGMLGIELGLSATMALAARVPLLPVVPPDLGFELECIRCVMYLVVATEVTVRTLGQRTAVSAGRSSAVILVALSMAAALARVLGGDHPLAEVVLLVLLMATLVLWDARHTGDV